MPLAFWLFLLQLLSLTFSNFNIMNKQVAIDSLKDMPQDFDLDELIERLVVLEKIEKGKKDVKNSQTVTHEEAKSKLNKWLK